MLERRSLSANKARLLMQRRNWLLGLTLGSALLAGAAASAAAASAPPELAAFLAERGRIAAALSEPIAACVQRHDTDNPAFHGCIDWHSSVHGTWALTAYGWATGDTRYRALVDGLLAPALIAQERKHLAANPRFEMPYGRAWFLRLAIDHRRATGSELLTPMADDIARSIVARYSASPPDPTAIAYRSATWALINLYDYATLQGDRRTLAFVEAAVRARYLTDQACPLQSVELEPGEFMAVCTNWAWLVSKVLPHDQFVAWLGRFLPAELPLAPVAQPASIHQVGLNFSRAWGLWNLYRATGARRYLDLYLGHIDATYRRPELWKGEYDTVAHWVAQFGMLALVVSYYDMH